MQAKELLPISSKEIENATTEFLITSIEFGNFSGALSLTTDKNAWDDKETPLGKADVEYEDAKKTKLTKVPLIFKFNFYGTLVDYYSLQDYVIEITLKDKEREQETKYYLDFIERDLTEDRVISFKTLSNEQGNQVKYGLPFELDKLKSAISIKLITQKDAPFLDQLQSIEEEN